MSRPTGNKKILLRETVLEASRKRISWLFDEFENVIVSHSGGKDSTVVFNLALEEATRRGRLPLPVLFVDQEGEWQATIDLIKSIMYRPDVKPLWYQMHFKINNAASFQHDYLNVWGPGEEWMREKDPVSIKETPPGVVDWYDLFPAIMEAQFGNEKACFIGGIRTEESPNRMMSTTRAETHKGRTWGRKLKPGTDQFTFYPIYDWSYTDVWKAIHEFNWPYCKIYDAMYQYGVPVSEMRVSSLFHESSVRNLFYMQEVEPANYLKLVKRLNGVDMAGKMGPENFFCPDELPSMFSTWKEYRDHLLNNLITNEEHRSGFAEKFERLEIEHFYWLGDALHRREIQSILTNDFGHWKLSNISVPRHLYDKHKELKRERREARKARASLPDDPESSPS